VSVMRAKMRVSEVKTFDNTPQETLTFNAVCASTYPEDGTDENNSFALWTPSAYLTMSIMNPALHGKFAIGDTFYVDFTPAN
jgi:hypothetical protein